MGWGFGLLLRDSRLGSLWKLGKCRGKVWGLGVATRFLWVPFCEVRPFPAWRPEYYPQIQALDPGRAEKCRLSLGEVCTIA